MSLIGIDIRYWDILDKLFWDMEYCQASEYVTDLQMTVGTFHIHLIRAATGEKNCLRGFRPGLTQTDRRSHKGWLDA